jgi:hypothetical protein
MKPCSRSTALNSASACCRRAPRAADRARRMAWWSSG